MSEDVVNHPKHYERHAGVGFECIELSGRLGFLAGNVAKYTWRYKAKNGVEDLRKARWYANAMNGEPDLMRPFRPADLRRVHAMLEALSEASDETEADVWRALRDRRPDALTAALDRLIAEETA